MGIKASALCSFCNTENDSVEHMLIECNITKELWREAWNWIIEIGVPGYHLSEEKIITGELEKSVCINTIIMLTKKVIYNAMKEVKYHILAVEKETKNFYFQEKYRLCVKGRRHIFERKYSLLCNKYEQY